MFACFLHAVDFTDRDQYIIPARLTFFFYMHVIQEIL